MHTLTKKKKGERVQDYQKKPFNFHSLKGKIYRIHQIKIKQLEYFGLISCPKRENKKGL